jgi:D-glycero-D-manno-heptose 1,7-bisphosphate phosphatase
MNKAVFLDRDGVLNRERECGYTCRLEDFDILPGVGETLRLLKDKGYKLIVVSNQSGVGKGLYKHEDVQQLHDHLRKHLTAHGVALDEIYYCLHHPDKSNCLCRKPGPLFIEKGIARFSLDPSLSFFVGDKEHRDMEAARRAGIQGILIKANSPINQILPYIG